MAPLDPVNLTLIQQCLQAGGHKEADSRFKPKRLLDLGHTDEFLPRVIDTATVHKSINDQLLEYVALSYCWGPPVDARQQLLLTAESKGSLYRGIKMASLTPVVRDAVITCRAIGFRFLWVDALCILQHDLADWEEQSYDMEKVFAGSALAICAIANSSCLGSFLERTRPRLDLALASANALSPAGTITLLKYDRDKMFPYDSNIRDIDSLSPFHIDLRVSPWRLRGWIFRKFTLFLICFLSICLPDVVIIHALT